MASVEVPDWPAHLPPASRRKIEREDGTWRNRVKQMLSDTAGSLGDDAAGDASSLLGLARASTLLDELTREAEAEARAGEMPLSWSEIGAALGISKQAAQQRYGKG